LRKNIKFFSVLQTVLELFFKKQEIQLVQKGVVNHPKNDQKLEN